MLRDTGDYRVERWFAGGVPLVTVRAAGEPVPRPAVVIYHRFAGEKTDDLLRLALPLADMECVAVLPEAALHGERAPHDFARRREHDRDGLFVEALAATTGEAEGILEWVAGREEVDPERLAVVGTSMGGAVALSLACRKLSHPLRAAVALMPAVPGPGSAVRQRAVYETPDARLCFPTPLLMIHGTADYLAPYPNARHFYDELAPTYSEAPERLRFIDMPGDERRVGTYWIEETLSWLGRFL